MFQTLSSLRVSSEYVQNVSQVKLVTRILLFRVLCLLAMATFCRFIPDHNPGDDVPRFPLRLDSKDGCFCQAGHACQWGLEQSDVPPSDSSCSSTRMQNSAHLSTAIWKFLSDPLTKWDAARLLHLAVNPTLRDPPVPCLSSASDIDSLPQFCDFTPSEQAHAFFPLFPILVRYLAQAMTGLLPSILLPPTFEASAAWAGWCLNTCCVVVAALSLRTLTISKLQPLMVDQDAIFLANAVVWVYAVWNPAMVFFLTNYTEALFSALCFTGYALFARGFWILGVACWMLASCTRSNGSIQVAWLFLQVIATICFYVTSRQRLKRESFLRMMAFVCFLLVAAVLVVLPVWLHDWQGYSRHCQNALVESLPEWCPVPKHSWMFSLYGWTQRRHWNVGPFYYYELKQIPNFLLASPILILSICGVVHWIRCSLIHDYGKGKLPQLVHLFWGWPLQALSDSVHVPLPNNDYAEAHPGFENRDASLPYKWLVQNPFMLSDYAVLALLVLIALVMAHIQISTRLLCSSSPALMWFLTYCHVQTGNKHLRDFVGLYTVLYILLGMALHVNFLPWT